MASIRYRALTRRDALTGERPGVADCDAGVWVDDPRLKDADWAMACRVADDLNATDPGMVYADNHPAIGNDAASPPDVYILDGLMAAAKAKADAEGISVDDVITRALWKFMAEPKQYHIPMRNMLKEETAPYSHLRVRTVYEGGVFSCHCLYIMGGNPQGRDYTTDRGLLAAIKRNADVELPERPPSRRSVMERYVRNESWNIADVHARLRARAAAGEVPWGYVPSI
jgi:hypothetical protein